jgi:hypothetical protein
VCHAGRLQGVVLTGVDLRLAHEVRPPQRELPLGVIDLLHGLPSPIKPHHVGGALEPAHDVGQLDGTREGPQHHAPVPLREQLAVQDSHRLLLYEDLQRERGSGERSVRGQQGLIIQHRATKGNMAQRALLNTDYDVCVEWTQGVVAVKIDMLRSRLGERQAPAPRAVHQAAHASAGGPHFSKGYSTTLRWPEGRFPFSSCACSSATPRSRDAVLRAGGEWGADLWGPFDRCEEETKMGRPGS